MLFSSAFPGMFGTFVKYKFQRTYDAILAAPVDTEELVTAEALWIAIRAGIYGCAPMLVAMLFGLDPSWGMLLVPFIGFIAGFGWASFGIARRRADELDRQLQLRDQRRADAAVPRRRHVLPDRRPARVGAGRRAAQPALPPRRSSSATPSSASSRAPTSVHLAVLRRLRPADLAARHPLDDEASSST